MDTLQLRQLAREMADAADEVQPNVVHVLLVLVYAVVILKL
jgi:hypothetical protein